MTDLPQHISATAFLRLVAAKQVRTQTQKVQSAAQRLGLTVQVAAIGEPRVGPTFIGPGGTFPPGPRDGNAEDAARALQAAGLPVSQDAAQSYANATEAPEKGWNAEGDRMEALDDMTDPARDYRRLA